MSEFSLIQQYFFQKKLKNSVNQLGIGDDCALMQVPIGNELAITTDTMVEGTHFFAGADPYQLGYKLLAVNLSDLAAMGAKPVSVTLALTLPEINNTWLKEFSDGFRGLANKFSVDLIGGDTTSGPLTLTVQAFGLLPNNQALKRSFAKIGDLIFVTGSLGDAGLGLKIEQGYSSSFPEQALRRFHQPEPRIDEGLSIRRYANACIDISDGVASDLRHILDQSRVGAKLNWDQLPLSQQVSEYIKVTDDWALPLTAGEDYELCFTVSPTKLNQIDIDCTQIGVIEEQQGLRIQRFGVTQELKVKGFEHFC